MFLNNKVNISKQNEKQKTVQCSLFSFTGVRFFQPKFMESLNSTSQQKIISIKNSDLIKKQDEGSNEESRWKDKKGRKGSVNERKQNMDPKILTQNQKRGEITQNVKEIYIKNCRINGLNNIGNTCYMNSILQCLLNLSRFNTILVKEVSISKSNKLQMVKQYKNLVEQFINPSNFSPFTPSKLKNYIGKKKNRFVGTAQQDAQQFLTAFLEIINQQTSRVKQKAKYIQLENDPKKNTINSLSQQWWNYYKKRDDSIICDYFQGQLISTVTCKKCKNQSVTFDNIWGLPLSLSKSPFSTSELIRNNWSVQNQISDYYCCKCKKHRDCTKKVQFFKLPQILVIQLKRFQYGKWKKEKIKTSIKLSDTLNLGECLHKNAQNQNHLYKLSSMVHHYGEVDYGHYTASVYKDQQRKWYLINDSKTSQNIPDSPSNTVYLLFYQRVYK